MFDQLQRIKDVQDLTARIDPRLFGIAILVSLLASLFASWLYARFYERRGTGSQINRAFPLLGISITALFICIQVSLPLSLGLLGALSIIRFRTPIKEPEEVGFIMLVIASSITCATLNFPFLLLLNVVALATLTGLRLFGRTGATGGDGVLMLSTGDEATAGRLRELTDYVAANTGSWALDSSARKDGVTSLQFTFSGLKGDAAAFQQGIWRSSDGGSTWDTMMPSRRASPTPSTPGRRRRVPSTWETWPRVSLETVYSSEASTIGVGGVRGRP